MAERKSTGGVVFDTRRKDPVFALRFRANGRRQYVTLGSAADGWTQKKAEEELANVLADVRRGIWRAPDRSPAPAAPALTTDPTFHEFASRWVADNEGEWRPNTRLDYAWQLTNHLLPFFAKHRLTQITIAEVDRYRAAKVREWQRREHAIAAAEAETEPAARRRKLTAARAMPGISATSINKTITRLGQILEVAVEYDLIDRNPAKGKRRRVKASKPAPVWLDRAEHIRALLDAAGEQDRGARHDRRHIQRRAVLSTLTFAGLRIGELIDLRWRDVDLTGGRITVRAAKTDAGRRQVDMLPVLRDELLDLKASARRTGPNDLVFATREGSELNPSNVRNRILAPAIELANERLHAADEVPLPQGLTPHKLRHTFASVLVALGTDPGSVMDQLGHTDAAFTLRVYRHGMRRDQASKDALRVLVGGEPAVIGQQAGSNDAAAAALASWAGE